MLMKDPNFFLDSVTSLPRERKDVNMTYRIDLSVPYRRALAFELLRLTAEDLSFTITTFQVCGEDISLERKMLTARSHGDEETRFLLDESERNLDRIWGQYDADGNGIIDEHELSTYCARYLMLLTSRMLA